MRSLRSLFLVSLLLGGWTQVLAAQIPELQGPVSVNRPVPAAVPFGPGEYLEYDVRLGALGKRGEGHMAVIGLDTIRGRTVYHTSLAMRGGLIWTQVNDHYQSWFDVSNLATLRIIQDIDELAYERFRHYEIYPEQQRFERRDKIASGDIPTSEPLDEITFFYFVRTLPLEVGEEYSFNRYYRETGNPVILRVLRKETVTVPAGTFPTIVVQPLIKSSGLFGQGGEAQLYFSDDENRYLVLMTSKVPLIGALSLHLKSVKPGRPLVSPPGGSGAP